MSKYIGILIIIALVAGVFAYMTSRQKPLSATPQQSYSIVAFGDSLTEGYKVDPKENYPTILEQRIKTVNPNVSIVNMGKSGDTTEQGLARIDAVIKARPDVVLLCLGANDLLRNLPPADARKNLEEIIVRLKNEGIVVILMGVKTSITNTPEYRKEFDAIYPELAEKYELTLIPSFLKGVMLNSQYTIQDRLHPNGLGYAKIVDENIFPVIKDLFK